MKEHEKNQTNDFQASDSELFYLFAHFLSPCTMPQSTYANELLHINRPNLESRREVFSVPEMIRCQLNYMGNALWRRLIRLKNEQRQKVDRIEQEERNETKSVVWLLSACLLWSTKGEWKKSTANRISNICRTFSHYSLVGHLLSAFCVRTWRRRTQFLYSFSLARILYEN